MRSVIAIVGFVIILKYCVFSQQYSFNNPYYELIYYIFHKASIQNEYPPQFHNSMPIGPIYKPYIYNNYIPKSNFKQYSFEPYTSTETSNTKYVADKEKTYTSTVTKESITDHPNWYLINEDDCGENLSDRIIGGKYANMGQYPWIALIGFYNTIKQSIDFMCGATLITPCWIVTAAHCVHNLPSTFIISEIRLGEYNLNTDIDCVNGICADKVQNFGIKRIITHENFNDPKLQNDIALIQLNKVATISQWVKPICLPYNTLLDKNLTSEMVEVAGWGFDNPYTKQQSPILKTVFLPIKSLSHCEQAFKKSSTVTNTQICVGGIIGSDSCNGDSGGPLMKVDVEHDTPPRYYMFGIVSFGAKLCGQKPVPAVYTNIAKFMMWILNHITEC